MLRRCRSWRFNVVRGHDGHDKPGACRECWTPCFAPIAKTNWKQGERRCGDCERSLIHCQMVSVRRALVADPFVTPSVLKALRSDPSGPVSMAAEKALYELEAPTTRKSRRRMDTGVVELNLDQNRGRR